MSAQTHQSMTNHHELSLLAQLSEVFHVWHRRSVERSELAAWTDRDLQDIGLSRDDVFNEVEKPFWRA